MNYLKIYCLLIACLLSDNLFSQGVTAKELKGVWAYVTDDVSFVLNFKNDSILIKDTQDKRNQIYSYHLDSTQEGYLLTMKSNKVFYEITPIVIYCTGPQ